MEHGFSTANTTVTIGTWNAGAAWVPEDEATDSTHWGSSEDLTLVIPDSHWSPGVWEYVPGIPTQEWVSGPESPSLNSDQQETTNDCEALVQAEPLTSATSQYPAYQQQMSGRLFATTDGVLFFPAGTGRGQTKRTIYKTSTSMTAPDKESSEEEKLSIAKTYMSCTRIPQSPRLPPSTNFRQCTNCDSLYR